jgi:DNA-binding FadR family transcriptional regulator
MREIIEPAAAGRAAERATEEEIAAIGRAMDGIEHEERGGTAQIQADVDFHMALLEASHNPMLRSVGALIESALEITFTMGWRMASDAVLQHRAVYDAIRLRQPDEAFMAMRRLLRNAKGNVFDALWMARTAAER